MPYCQQVKHRLTSWLLAVLLAATAGLSAPSTRALSSRAESPIVCVSSERRIEAEIAEPSKPTSPVLRQISSVVSVDHQVRLMFPLDRALFQRPPPSFLRS